ncbi:MAG: polysaccharide biosynthesis protein [Prevotella sp.]|nr:polysaccharide biosynthesis protein [Prevotella sp.]
MYKKIINWYLTRDAMPYWIVLLFDTCIVFMSGVLAYMINHGCHNCVINLSGLCYTLLLYQICFCIGFRLFHTYYGITHHTSFTDLASSLLALFVGVIIIMVMRIFFKIDAICLNVRLRDLLLQTLFAVIGMCGLRILIKILYDEYCKRHAVGGAYGWADQKLLDMEMKELLPRESIHTDMTSVNKKMGGKCILVTGAAGSIGSELSRQLASCHPKMLILVDQAETPLHDLQLCMESGWSDVECHFIVTSMCNSNRMEHIFKEYKPEIVFHAAAYKHVPMMEENPEESILNNVVGTKKLAFLATKYKVSEFIMISTDKAVNPTSVMGCSKRICEIFCQSLSKALEKNKGCKFITTRFGNVLGSNGSVIPIFRQQIRHGGPVTVTHPDVKRYFMLIPEACQLVLQAATMGKGGEIFVFDMGKQVRIADLAKRMIDLSGNRNIKIVYTGLRPGEKLYEELLEEKEREQSVSQEKIKIAEVREYDFEDVYKQINKLIETAETCNANETIQMMKQIVPEYSISE